MSNTLVSPMLSYPRHMTGPEALDAFLEATRKTPTVGQSVYEFTIRGRSEGDADRFVQAMRSALSKHRRNYKKQYGRKAQPFAMTIVSRHVDKETGLVLVALGRKQRGKGKETLGIELLSSLTSEVGEENSNWRRMIDELTQKPEIHISVYDWDTLALAMILVYQQNAVYKGVDKEREIHKIGRT